MERFYYSKCSFCKFGENYELESADYFSVLIYVCTCFGMHIELIIKIKKKNIWSHRYNDIMI